MAQFNSVEFAWKDIQVSLLGRMLVRILEVEYEDTVDMKEIFGRGNKPLAIQTGNYKFKGKLKVGQSEYNALVAAAQKAGKRLPDLSLTLDIAYTLEASLRRDRVTGLRIPGSKKALKQGDSDMEIDLAFIALDVQEDIG